MQRHRTNAAFTLTELLIVIGLIVLVIALAVPSFKAMTGGRSVDAAQNQLAAVLGGARSEAIGLQKVRGVFFYVDPATERVNAALVREADYTPPSTITVADPPDYYLDLVADRDPIALPVGVGLQGIDNADVAGGVRRDDGYIGYNPVRPADLAGGGPPAAPILYGGVILFDGSGRVVNKHYGFQLGETVVDDTGRKRFGPTRMAEMFGYVQTETPPYHFIPRQSVGGGAAPMQKKPPLSLFGFILFDSEPFKNLGYTEIDPQYEGAAGSYTGTELAEETWLDNNAVPVLINRYNGTLVRGE